MKKTLLTCLSIMAIIGCKKDFKAWEDPLPLHRHFNYKDGLKWLKKPDGEIPTNPFVIDSIAPGAYQTYNGYWVTSSNGLSYVMPPTDIRPGLLNY